MYEGKIIDGLYELGGSDVATVCVVAATGCNAVFTSPLLAQIAGVVSEIADGGADAKTPKYVGKEQGLTDIPPCFGKRVVVNDALDLSVDDMVRLKYMMLLESGTQFIVGAPTVTEQLCGDIPETERRWSELKEMYRAADIVYDPTSWKLPCGIEFMVDKTLDIKKELALFGGSPWAPGYSLKSIRMFDSHSVLKNKGREMARRLGLFERTLGNAKTLALAFAAAKFYDHRPDEQDIEWIRHISRPYWVSED